MVEAFFREPSGRESQIIDKLISVEFSGRDSLRQQFSSAKVKRIDEDGSFEVLADRPGENSCIKYVVPVEGEYEDTDGVTVHILVHTPNGVVSEVEFYREDGTQVRTWPVVENVRVFAPE